MTEAAESTGSTEPTEPTEPNRTRTRWRDRRTLRFRVVASLLLTMVAAFAVVGFVTLTALTHFLTGRLDDQIKVAGPRYVATEIDPTADTKSNDDGGFGDARGQAVDTLGAKIEAGQITGFGIVGRPATATISSNDRRILTTLAAGSSESVDLGAFGDYRLHAFAGTKDATVVVGLPLRPLHETVAELLAAELIAFGVVLVVTAASSRWLVSLSLRPLARVTAMAREVAGTPLSADEIDLPHRVQVADPTTEVGQLAEAFNQMLDHVESSLTTRRDSEERLRRFIADASHELRTPVAAIRGHAESVRHTPEAIPSVVADSMRRIESEAARMGVLVNDLLLLARLDAGRPLNREPVDLTRLVIDAADDARVAGPEHRWSLDLPEHPVTVVGDEHRLLEVLTNLLTNARVHTPARTAVEVRLSVDPNGEAVVVVADDGPGIPDVAQHRVFERFFRADNARAPETGSSGLGLAIVIAIVRAHEGTVVVRSQPGQTEFEVRLPPSGSREDRA